MEIVLLTENILVEEKLQLDLQDLGHEVFVSKSFIERLEESYAFNFDVYIISNTIPKKQKEKIVNKLKKKKSSFIFKLSNKKKEVDVETIDNMKKETIIYEYDTLETLNEKIEVFDTLDEIVSSEKMHILGLSKNEKKIFIFLLENFDTTISRKALCELMWNGMMTDSNLSQLSSLIKRINRKLDKDGRNNLTIKTSWKNGYYCTWKN